MEQVAQTVVPPPSLEAFETQLDKATWYDLALGRRLYLRPPENPSNLSYPTIL